MPGVASVYAPPGRTVNCSNFIFCRYITLCPRLMHMKYLVKITCTFWLAAILLKIVNCCSVSIVKLRSSILHPVIDSIWGYSQPKNSLFDLHQKKSYKCYKILHFQVCIFQDQPRNPPDFMDEIRKISPWNLPDFHMQMRQFAYETAGFQESAGFHM